MDVTDPKTLVKIVVIGTIVVVIFAVVKAFLTGTFGFVWTNWPTP